MASGLETLFASAKNKKPIETVLWRGENPYIEKEFKELLKKEVTTELKSFQVGKSGLDVEIMEASQGGFLFSPLVVLFLKFSGSVGAWKKEAQANLEDLLERADPAQLIVVLQVPSDKRLKWDGLKCKTQVSVEELSDSERLFWLKRMNEKAGAKLDDARINFLLNLEPELMQNEKNIELWNLGGDLWAEVNLTWSAASPRSKTNERVKGSAFDWVDLVFQKNSKNSMQILQDLLQQGEDPIKLLALISKSVRILTLIELGKDLEGAPPFLIQKLKRYKGQSSRLLQLCREADVFLKSTSANSKLLVQRLSTL